MRPSPSLLYNNLTATPAGLAYIHKRQVWTGCAPPPPLLHWQRGPLKWAQPAAVAPSRGNAHARRAGHQRACAAHAGRSQRGDQAGGRPPATRANEPCCCAASAHDQRGGRSLTAPVPAAATQVDTQETGTVHTVRCCKAGNTTLLVVAGEGGVQVRRGAQQRAGPHARAPAPAASRPRLAPPGPAWPLPAPPGPSRPRLAPPGPACALPARCTTHQTSAMSPC
jgi:hypothetical protein